MATVARVVGSDPGTSRLDLLLLENGEVANQASLEPSTLRANPALLTDLLAHWSPIDLIAGPSGYGLPLVRGEVLTEREFDLMALVRPDERGDDLGVIGFRSWVRAFRASGFPLVFLPGLIHLASVPGHRKANTIDLGTPDKLAVAALGLRVDAARRPEGLAGSTFAVVEIGSAFSAVLVVCKGQLVDASAGTRGPIGLRSGGAWDGEVACWKSPISKNDLFRGGLIDLGPEGPDAFRESLIKHVAALRAVTPFERLYLSGAGIIDRPQIATLVRQALGQFGELELLPSLPGATVKHAAQGAALLADGLLGGANADLVESLGIRHASGTVLDGLRP